MMILQNSLSKFILTVLLGISTLLVHAQNLVPNGGFEDGSCEGYLGNITECENWFSSIIPFEETTPEWYHTCIELDFLSPPEVIYGNKVAFESGYAGLATFPGSTAPAASDYREIIGVQLTQPLEEDALYLVNLKFSPISISPKLAILTSNFGFNFSTHPFYHIDDFPINSSHFAIDTIVALNEPDEWYDISVIFEADSAYEYLHLGNFYSNSLTNISFGSDNAVLAYYLVDEVSVTQTLDVFEAIEKDDLVVYPNPTSDELFFHYTETQNFTVSIFNLEGIRFFIGDFNKNLNEYSIDVSGLTAGTYYIVLETPKLTIHEKFIKF